MRYSVASVLEQHLTLASAVTLERGLLWKAVGPIAIRSDPIELSSNPTESLPLSESTSQAIDSAQRSTIGCCFRSTRVPICRLESPSGVLG